MRSRLPHVCYIFIWFVSLTLFFSVPTSLSVVCQCDWQHRVHMYVLCMCVCAFWVAHWLGFGTSFLIEKCFHTYATSDTISRLSFRFVWQECTRTHTIANSLYSWMPFTRHSRHLTAKNGRSQWASSISGHMNTDRPINTAKYTEKETEAII